MWELYNISIFLLIVYSSPTAVAAAAAILFMIVILLIYLYVLENLIEIYEWSISEGNELCSIILKCSYYIIKII